MVQEAYATHPAIREACEREITGHAMTLAPDIAALLARRGRRDIDPAGLALHIQGVLQGAFILAKATGDAQVAADSLGHLRRYLTLLFEPQTETEALS
jgi:TetR/AcrR family transcriptional repressor of nem operon